MGHFCGDRLRQARLAAGLTREDLAQRAGVRSADRIRDWERGVHAPQARFVPRLAAALGVDPVALYGVDPARPPLRVLRLARGLSLQQLAELAGVPIMTCQRIEQGRGHRHDQTALDQVSRVLGIPAGYPHARRDREAMGVADGSEGGPRLAYVCRAASP